jgi:DNA-binding response OmpR family regulator
LRLLVVEDDPDIAQAMTDLLSFAGYGVLVASDGQGALRLARHCHFALVLLDWGLPGSLVGRDLIRSLRAIVGREVPFLVCSAERRARYESAGEGVAGFVAKPFANEELLAQVAALCHRTEERAAERRGRAFRDR